MSIRARYRIKKQVARGKRYVRPWPGRVGDGAGTIEVPGYANLWYVRPEGSDLPIPVYRGSAPREDGYPVWVGQDVYNKRWLRILGVDYERAVNGGVTVSEVGPHAGSHLLSGSDPGYFDVRQILNVLAYASSGMTVHVNAGWVIIDGQLVKIASTNIDMTTSIPDSGAAYSIIQADSTGALSVVDGTPVGSLLDLTDDDAPSFAGGYAAIALVRLWLGQTELSRSSTQPDVTPLYLAQNNDVPMTMLSDMVEPTGFIDRTTSTIAFTDGTLTFEIAPTGTTFSFYSAGVKFSKTAQTKAIADTAGMHHIYFDTSGVLQESTDEWDINSANVPVAAVLWDGSAGLLMDERHGIQMDGQTQEYLHETRGSAFASGMAGTFAADGSTITIGAGEWYDEDIEYITTEKTQCRVFYLDSTVWKWSAAQNAYYTAVSSVPQYNNSGALANVGVAKYSISWIYMTNMITTPIVVVMGQAEYNTQALAEAAGVPALTSLPAEEMILLYKVIWQRNGAVITWKRTDDYRRILGGPTADYIATDHGALAGLNDPDHPASAITVDTTNFDGNLSAADTTVQAALETLDELVAGGAIADHDHSGDAGDGGSFDAANLTSGAATDGYVLTADGSGGAAWEESAGGAVDAADVTYTPTTLTDWDSDADPGNVDDALDQLAERVDDFEAANAKKQAIFTREGVVTASVGTIRIANHTGRTLTISGVYLDINTAPTGANLIVDIHNNGTTIFTTQSNRPVVVAANNSGNSTTIEAASWTDGQYLTCDVDQVGSTVAGSDLTITVVYT